MMKKIIQLVDGWDYWEREILQPLEKVQENDIGQNKIEPKEEKRVNKLMYIGDQREYRLRGGRGKSNRDY